MARKRKKGFKGISAFEERRQDQAASKDWPDQAKAPTGWSKMTPAQKAKAVMSQPTTGGKSKATKDSLNSELRTLLEAGDKGAEKILRQRAKQGSIEAQGILDKKFGVSSEEAQRRKAAKAQSQKESDRLMAQVDKEIAQAEKNAPQKEAEGKDPYDLGGGSFDKKIGFEDPQDDNFSDAAGLDANITPDNVDIAETVLEARKEYLANAKKNGSDTSEADAQVKEIQDAIDRANKGETTQVATSHTSRKLSPAEVSALKKAGGGNPAKGARLKAEGKLKRPKPRQPKGTRSAKQRGLPQHGPKNPKGGFGNWRRQRRDPRTGRWV